MSELGWIGVNLSYLHSEEQVARILAAVKTLAELGHKFEHFYQADAKTARFNYIQQNIEAA